MENLFLGIDLGSSFIKVAVQNTQGDYVYEDSVSYEYDHLNDLWTEINPEIWWEIVLNQLQKIFCFSWSDRVVGISLTGQMHTTVFIDKDGLPVRNAIMWNDKRTKVNIKDIKLALNKQESTKINAQTVSTGSPLANILWLRENEKQNFEKVHKFIIAKDYINFMLTGKFSTDYCDASTSSMYDFNQENWSEDIKKIFNLPEKIFPKISNSADRLGVIKPDIKRKLNLKHDIDVFVGTGDNAATYFASESFDSKDFLISIGTSGVVLMPSDRKKLSTRGKNIAFKLFKEDQYTIVQGSLSTGGKSLSWWVEEVLQTKDISTEQLEIDLETILEAKEIFIPHMIGEKYIYKNEDLKSTFLNITPLTSRKRLTLSVLEGVSFAIKNLSDNLTKNNFCDIKIIGGGAKSTLWKNIFASLYQQNIKDYSHSASAVNGAIKIAKAGYFKSSPSTTIEYTETLADNDKLKEIYIEKFNNYLIAVSSMNQYYISNSQTIKG